MNTIQKTLVVAALAAAVGSGIYEMHRASFLQERERALMAQQASLTAMLEKEREDAANRLAAAEQRSAPTPVDQTELRKLRAEVARLRGAGREVAQLKAAAALKDSDPEMIAMRSWVDRVTKLRTKLAQAPERRIPEFQFLSDQDWFTAVSKSALETDAEVNQAMSALRTAAKDEFAGTVQSALRSYAQANNGQAPSDLSQLQPYFGSTVDSSIFQRYQMGQSGTVTEVATPQDEQNDTFYQITQNTINSSSHDEDALQAAAEAYSAANSGQAPTDPSQLAPYIKTAAEQAALQRLLQKPAGQ